MRDTKLRDVKTKDTKLKERKDRPVQDTRVVPDEPAPTRRPVTRVAIIVLGVIVLVWLAAWLVQRSFQTPAKKRAVQSWLDEKLNADVLLLGDMVVRANLVRNSRLFLHEIEIEHPNPVFPGKFARIERFACWAQPWSVAKLIKGDLDILLTGAHFTAEESDGGDWSTDGFMQPLAAGNTRFPFPLPRIARWKALVERSDLTVRRQGYEFKIELDGHASGRRGSKEVVFHSENTAYSFGEIGDDANHTRGTITPVNLRFLLGETAGDRATPIAGRCGGRFSNLPIGMLPFIVSGIPMESAPGVFNGLIRYDEHPDAAGALHLDGELADAPLTVFGLPRNSPLRLTWPIMPNSDGQQATIHMGPAGFGAFEISVALDEAGRAKQLNMRGDVADLDDMPVFFSKYSRWPEWMSRTFLNINWRTGSWRGFGWRGENLQLSLTRSTAGMNLSGEGEMMGGRVRLSMTPDQPEAPITIAAERLDPVRLSVRLSRLLPEAFRTRITGSNVNLTWRGFPSPAGTLDEWGTGMVWAKSIVDVSASGEFWKTPGIIARAVAGAMPEWGGGDTTEILALTREGGIPLDQLSIVSESDGEGGVAVEFRAFGDLFGQATGLIEKRRDGTIEGEFLLAGPSRLLRAVENANADFANALDLLAHESPGLRVRFVTEPDGGLAFSFPFLDDARRVQEALRQGGDVRVDDTDGGLEGGDQ